MQSAEEEVLRNQGYTASTSEIGTSEIAAAQGLQDNEALNGRYVGSSVTLCYCAISELHISSCKNFCQAVCLLVLFKIRGLTLSFILSRLAAPSSPFEDDSDDVDEQPLVRHRPRRAASGSLAPPNDDRSRSRSPEGDDNAADSGNGFPSEVSIKSV